VVKLLSGRRWLVAVVFAVIGMLIGLAIAFVFLGQSKRFAAQTTLAMLPASYIPTSEAAQFWEVLNNGQATRSAAIVLAQGTWLQSAAAAAGVPPSELSLTAGPIRDTTLIEVTLEANSSETAEAALDSVLNDAVPPAIAVSGPFRLEVIKPADGSAKRLGPGGVQTYVTAAIAGLALGFGVALLASRLAERKDPEHVNHARHAVGPEPPDTDGFVHTTPISSEPPAR
jgi:capsular polysaccharide biosynthesis protein